MPPRILIVTDAWAPQTNGVVTTLTSVTRELERLGLVVDIVEPSGFVSLPLPSYPEIRVAVNPWSVGRRIRQLAPDAIHIATEGPLGLAARAVLARVGLPFTTSVHTKFPEYIHARIRLPVSMGYRFMRWFHRPAVQTLVTTESHRRELEGWGFRHLRVWSRGVDTRRFVPLPRRARLRPRLLYVGRVAVEKNLEAFLNLDLDAELVVVGGGPQRRQLAARYPEVRWLGYQHGETLARSYAEADVLVFPSLTDTFGLVMLEAMACGTPVAAYPVTGPRDVVVEGVTGALDEDLGKAIRRALRIDRSACRREAEQRGWDTVAREFAELLVTIDWARPGRLGAPLADRLGSGLSVRDPIERPAPCFDDPGVGPVVDEAPQRGAAAPR